MSERVLCALERTRLCKGRKEKSKLDRRRDNNERREQKVQISVLAEKRAIT